MVAYSFKERFVDPIRAGTKLHTVRAARKRHARPGEGLQLYAGMRTKNCRLIAMKDCAATLRIFVAPLADWVAVAEGYPWPGKFSGSPFAASCANRFSYVDIEQFSRRDGFADWAEMRAFWFHEHPETQEQAFEGVLIRWWPK